MKIFKKINKIRNLKKQNEKLCKDHIKLHEIIDFYEEEIDKYKKRNRYLERKNTELTKALKEKGCECGTKENVRQKSNK